MERKFQNDTWQEKVSTRFILTMRDVQVKEGKANPDTVPYMLGIELKFAAILLLCE